MSKYKNTPTLPIKGISLDSEPIKQQDGFATFALNAVNDSQEGSAGTLVNEEGNTLCFSLPSGYHMVGHCQMDNNEVCIFSTNGTRSEIGVVQSCNYTTIVNSGCLNFDSFIQATYRLRRGNDRTIYFVDGENPDRYFIIDRPSSFYNNAFQSYLNGGGDPNTYVGERWDCNLFSIYGGFSRLNAELFTYRDTSSCGILSGTFSLGFAYVDANDNTTEYVHFTEPLAVYDDNFTQPYHAIEGNYNSDNYSANVGGLPKVNKSFIFNLSNVDTSFQDLKVIAVYYKSGDGITSTVYEIEKVAITGSNMIYTFDCMNENSIINASSVSINNSRYNSKVVTQSNNRLIKGNLKEREVDHFTLQNAANQIEVTYVTNAASQKDVSSYTNSLSPYNQSYGKSFMRDEIYDLQIQFLFDDGSVSDFYHIPGRERNQYADGTTMPLAQDDPHRDWDTSAPTNPTGGRTHREILTGNWDDATVSSSLNTNHLSGSLERWQVYNTALRTGRDSNYLSGDSQILNYTSGQLAYYESEQDYPDLLDDSGSRVFPSGKVRYHKMPDATLEPITYDDGTVSYTINLNLEVSNVSLPDGAIGYRIGWRRLGSILSKGYTYANLSNTQIDSVGYWGISDVQMYFSAEGDIYKSGLLGGTYIKVENEYYCNDPADVRVFRYNTTPKGNFRDDPTFYNREIEDSAFLENGETYDFETTSSGTISITNNLSYRHGAITVNDGMPIPNNAGGITFPDGSSQEFNSGYYIAMKTNISPTLYPSVIEWYNKNFTSNSSQIVYGDCFITRTIFSRHQFINNDGNRVFHGDEVYCETYINHELIHETDVDQDLLLEKRYNRDYDSRPHTVVYDTTPLEIFISGSNKFPNRITWSNVSFQNDFSDNYLSFQSNNIVDITDGTAINLLEEVNNRSLAVCTEKNFYQIPVNAQELQLDGVTAVLGTGSFLSTPPSKASFSEYGYAGAQSPLAVNKSELGLVWLDQNNGKVINYSTNINILSQQGMNSFFREHLQFHMNSDFKEKTGVSFPLLNHPDGVYSQVFFDPYYDRVIIHKRDYKPLFNYEIFDENNTYTNADIVYDSNIKGFRNAVSGVQVFFNNVSLFENKSYTLSFSKGAWTSFHSYLPDYSFNDGRFLYTSKDNQIWKHGEGPYQTFYTSKYDYIIEFVQNDINTSELHSIQWIGEVLAWDASSQEWSRIDDATFDRVWVYNNYQSTGIIDLVYPTNYYNDVINFVPNVQRTDDNYKVSNIRDRIRASSLGTSSRKDWASINTNYFIDKVPEQTTSLGYYQDPPIRSKWVKIRLFFNPIESYKINTELLLNKTKQSVR